MPKKKAKKNKQAATKKKSASKRKAKKSPRRARRPVVKARKGPMQLWLPLQMSLGLVGGEAGRPPELPADAVDDQDDAGEPASRHAGDQSSLW